jgi:serine/threonine-protein kinase
LRWSEAETAFTRAIDLRPGYSQAHHWYALLLTSHGRFDEALEQMNAGLAQDPLSVAARGALGFIHYMRGDFQAAIDHYRVAIDFEDRSWRSRT